MMEIINKNVIIDILIFLDKLNDLMRKLMYKFD